MKASPQETLVELLKSIRMHLEDYGEISGDAAQGMLRDVDAAITQVGEKTMANSQTILKLVDAECTAREKRFRCMLDLIDVLKEYDGGLDAFDSVRAWLPSYAAAVIEQEAARQALREAKGLD